MNFSHTLESYKKAINKELERYFAKAIHQAEKKDTLIAEALLHTQKIALAGGKRIRGALLCSAYFGLGGREKQKIFKIAAAIELVHLFLLMHDDIIDRGDLRHGVATLHRMLLQKNIAKMGPVQAAHFGDSMAIIVGEMLYADAVKLIAEAKFSSELTIEAIVKLQDIVTTTIVGQSQDILIAFEDDFDEEKILKMYANKTARYTFEGPLHMGAILAGCKDKKIMQNLSSFALPLGTAFQVQDDMLSIFGEEKTIGKSGASDIEEGKKTLLVAKALELGKKDESSKLQSLLGKKPVTKTEIKMFQQLLRKTGAFEYSKTMVNANLERGRQEISKIVMLSPQKNFLLGLVSYLEGRKI